MKTVLAHGCFDLLHLGHIRHLQEAKSLGDRLVVSVTADEFVAKGLGRPHFNAEQRAEALRALGCVDEVVINHAADSLDIIRHIRPDFYVKGIDYKTQTTKDLEAERKVVESVGGKLHFTSSAKWSSSSLINYDKFPEEVISYLHKAKVARFKEKILLAFERADKLNVRFVGELIVDKYCYVKALGRASKEPMLAVVETELETYDGGVIAASRHGEWKNSDFITVPFAIEKLRYVTQDFNRKVFDVYSSQFVAISNAERDGFRAELRAAAETCDVMVVFDFGHGLMTEVERGLSQVAKFSAVNAQTNAGNYGFNPITKYKSADLVCIDDPEARLASGLDRAPMASVIHNLAERISCKRWIITHGKNGSVFGDGTTIHRAPAFAAGGIDTMGAGDAALAVVAPLVGAGLELDAAAFVGNVVGAIKTTIIGHRRHVGRQEIIQTIEALLA